MFYKGRNRVFASAAVLLAFLMTFVAAPAFADANDAVSVALTSDRDSYAAGDEATFTLAVDNPPRRDGGNSTSFISCQAWTKTADNVCQYCHKGSLVAIDGRLSQRSYEGRDGSKRSIVEVICDKVQFLERKGSQESTSISAVAEPSADEPIESIDSADDDLPF